MSQRSSCTPSGGLNHVKWRRGLFGKWADYEVPDGCNAVVLCVMGGSHHQLHPVRVLLPGQVYEKDCVALLKEHDATEIIVIPYDSKGMVDIMKRDRHGR